VALSQTAALDWRNNGWTIERDVVTLHKLNLLICC
jgi:hypothetical protein